MVGTLSIDRAMHGALKWIFVAKCILNAFVIRIFLLRQIITSQIERITYQNIFIKIFMHENKKKSN
jgi:hypothetical protein